MLNPLNDGIDHINVYSKGRTFLGRRLSNFYPIMFCHPVYGWFDTVEGFYFFVSTGFKVDAFRRCKGFEAKALGKTYERVPCDNFELLIREAIRLKILQNPVLLKDLKDSTLPFKHYYVYGDPNNKYKIIKTKGFDYMMEEIEAVRKEIKNT